ncbi:hypothetical protein KI387_036156, partial [Taxus chinensis]
KVTEEADSEEIESLDAYNGEKDENNLEGGEDHPMYDIHDSEEEEGEEKHNKEYEEKNDEEEAEDQGKGVIKE